MKKILFILIASAIYLNSFGQFKVNSYGMVDIKAQTQDWWSGLKVTVPTKSSCSYNLWSTFLNRDVFFVCAEGYLWTLKGGYFGSDISFKENIKPIEKALTKVLNLNGVRYQFKEKLGEGGEPKNSEDFRLGFIAQEVEKVFPEVVKDMPDGTKAISYTDLIAVLVEAMKEQQAQIEQLYALIYDKESKSSFNNENEVQEIKDVNKAQLFQNKPNPFSVNTEIQFDIPQNTTSAKLLIHDMYGGEVKSYNIATKGIGNITIQASELSAGMYMYTLLVNNIIVDTKKMILTK